MNRIKASTAGAKNDDGVLVHKALRRACAGSGLSIAEAAQIVGISRSILSRDQGRLTGKSQQLGILLLRALRSLDGVLGGNSKHTKHWLHTYNLHLRGVPSQRMREPEGLVAVVHYIDAMRGKI